MHETPLLTRAFIAALVAALAACAPVWVASPVPVDAPRFNVRPPPPGRPDYLATIAYIDTHVRYADINARFLIGPTGDMCYSDQPGIYQCIPPRAVGRVAMDRYVELHCAKWAPYCAYKNAPTAFPPGYKFADKLQIREQFEDRPKLVDAIDHLLYLMGREKFPDPFAAKRARTPE